MLLRRRHDLVGIFCDDALNESTFIGIPRHHSDDTVVAFLRARFVVEAQVGLALLFIRAVAEEAVLA